MRRTPPDPWTLIPDPYQSPGVSVKWLPPPFAGMVSGFQLPDASARPTIGIAGDCRLASDNWVLAKELPDSGGQLPGVRERQNSSQSAPGIEWLVSVNRYLATGNSPLGTRRASAMPGGFESKAL